MDMKAKTPKNTARALVYCICSSHHSVADYNHNHNHNNNHNSNNNNNTRKIIIAYLTIVFSVLSNMEYCSAPLPDNESYQRNVKRDEIK